MKDAVSKYLTTWAEPEAALAADVACRFERVVVIPACGEGQGLLAALRSLPLCPAHSVLVIVVINARCNAPRSVHAKNAEALAALRKAYPVEQLLCEVPLVAQHGLEEGSSLLLIDKTGQGQLFAPNEGVGRARKLGCDVALALQNQGKISHAFIHCGDADMQFPPDYFDGIPASPSGDEVALLYPFVHLPEESTQMREAICLYDTYLRYYVSGLRWARSPYAFHTLGSVMAIEGNAYAAVRGFPNRAAAEDFYILNKLAKLGTITSLGQRSPIALSGRASDRVPFGTGAAVTELSSRERPEDSPIFYDPRVFACLGTWLAALESLAILLSRRAPPVSAESFLRSEVAVRAADWEGADVARLVTALENTDAFVRVQRSVAQHGPRLRQVHTSFDAFRTLKLLHALRDLGLPSLRWDTALARAPFARAHSATLSDARQIVIAQEKELGTRLCSVAQGCGESREPTMISNPRERWS